MSTVAGRGRAGSRGRSTNRIDANRVRSSEISYRAATATTKTKDFFTKDLRGGNMHRRIVSMFTVVAILLSLLGVRVALLQTLWASDYREASVSQRTRVQVMRAERGSILDRNGRELALPIPTRTVFADPRSVVDPVGVANVVAGVLQLDPQAESELAAKLQNKQSSFVYIARQADKEVADAILALGLKGVSSYRESGRALSSASLQAVVGRTDIDGVGISGLELKYHDLLTGIDGRIVREVNSSGKSIAAGSGEVLEPKSGGQLTTTIDRTIQFQVDGIVKQQVERLGARGGMAIVMDTKTGEIYAM
ncbi:MAG: peptidoglycan synthetase FtsI, partial [Actinomycetota bacterium]